MPAGAVHSASAPLPGVDPLKIPDSAATPSAGGRGDGFLPLEALDPGLDRRLDAILTKHRIPGAAIAALRGDDSYIKTHGVRGLNDLAPVTADTAFDIGSCSKSYVATAIAHLVGRGAIGFDDPVKPIVPELELDDPWITDHLTVRDLLCNRIGLARQVPVESFANPDIRVTDIAGRLKYLKRLHPFRSGYVYFNPGFMLAALVVERVAGMAYATFLERHLFGPLGMTGSASGLRPYQILSDRARGHALQDGRTVETRVPIFDNWQGAAGVYTCARDQLRWLRLHLAGGRPLLAPQALAQTHWPHTVMLLPETTLMHKPPESECASYCMGWWRTTLHGKPLVQHAGSMLGWRAQHAFMPGAGLGVWVALNVARDYHTALAYGVLEHLLSGAMRDWEALADRDRDDFAAGFRRYLDQCFAYRPGAPAAAPLEDLPGRYRHPGLGDFRVVRRDDGALRLQVMDGRVWDMALEHLGGAVLETRFVNPAADYLPLPGRIRMVVEDGQVVRLEDSNGTYERVE